MGRALGDWRQWLRAAMLCLLPAAASAQTEGLTRLRGLQDNPLQWSAAVDAGRKASFFCANCHGETGIAKTPEVPNLAGQNPAYLLAQIDKFGRGERKDAFMQGLIKVLKDEERVQIAAYYAQSPVTPGKADPAQINRGRPLYEKLCARCHGPAARGNDTVPRLAGQQLPYLIKSVTCYRDRTGERNSPEMANATAGLRNEDITALAHYLTQLP